MDQDAGNSRYLAHLLGPHAENEGLLLDLTLRLLRDYSHWRRNYFPDDPPAMSQATLRELQGESDKLVHAVNQMMAGLRRSFPFHSPRYVAHQQSETTLASLLGALAGSLYNSNNVTPESGAVTVDWEIDACNAVMKVLGLRCPPNPPTDAESESYQLKLRQTFGWAHITSGGTIANIEALWAARAVAYFPLAVWDACRIGEIPLKVKLPGEPSCEVPMGEIVDPYPLTRLKPNESIYMLGKFIAAVMAARGQSVEVASRSAMEMLTGSPYFLANGTSHSFSQFKPVVLVSGAAHYSVKKAADLLGIGSNGVRLIRMDASFRMDLGALREQLEYVARNREVPIAVVAIAGSTEEGAVDPIDKIASLRKKLENQTRMSFWLHTDAAWGGFVRTLFVEDQEGTSIRETKDAAIERVRRIGQLTELPLHGQDVEEWVDRVVAASSKSADSMADDSLSGGREASVLSRDSEAVKQYFRDLRWDTFFASIKRAVNGIPDREPLHESEFAITNEDAVIALRHDVAARVVIEVDGERKHIDMAWPSDEVGGAFLAIEKSDSISIDPHKMGYGIYPCGAVAFRNDRVRHLVKHEAPYITTSRGDGTETIAHLPPRHTKEGAVATMAFAPFTLEGSRPSSSACALWLASRALPFDRHNHGRMVRASILAARELFEWITHWNELAERNRDVPYRLVSYSSQVPDTNIVIFCAVPTGKNSIVGLNDLNNKVYSKFSIKAELGERQHSYSQAFFLSNTEFREPSYPYSTVRSFLARIKVRKAEADYKRHGLVVLRATVMNPYLYANTTAGTNRLLQSLMEEIDRAARANS